MRNTDKNGQYYFFCPYCHRIQVMQTSFMDGFIDCTCRNRFYAYADYGMSLVMPAEEVNQQPTAGVLHRFLNTIRNDTSQMYHGSGETARQKLARDLEEYQVESQGESNITIELVETLNSAFIRGMDVVLNKKKDGLDLREMAKPKRVSKTESVMQKDERFLEDHAQSAS